MGGARSGIKQRFPAAIKGLALHLQMEAARIEGIGLGIPFAQCA